MSSRILVGDCLDVLRTLDSESVQTCVTSPPYWGLRDYGVYGQIGLEATPEAYVARLVDVFREVRRVLKNDGTLRLNLGDSHATGGGAVGRCPGGGEQGARFLRQGHIGTQPNRVPLPGLKPKDLIGIPWRVAFALQADGWWLRSDIVWAKPNGMPESVRDRPTRSHEMVFLLSKSERYFYNTDSARTPAAPSSETRLKQSVAAQHGSDRAHGGDRADRPMKAVQRKPHGSTLTGAPHGRHALGDNLPENERRTDKQRGHGRVHAGFNERWDAMKKSEQTAAGSNLRTVWWLAPAQFREGHFATMPASLAEICIVAGTREDDTALDPFGGAGTTGLVAARLGRDSILIELNPDYAEMARRRITDDAPMFADVEKTPENSRQVAVNSAIASGESSAIQEGL